MQYPTLYAVIALASMTPLIHAVIECFLKRRPCEARLERFSSCFIEELIEQGALIPVDQNKVKLLGLTLTHHLRSPEHPIAWFNLAVALRLLPRSCPNDSKAENEGRLALAADACMKAISYSPDALRPWTELGIVLHMLEQPDDALAAFEEGLKLKTDDVPLCLWKAFSLTQLGQMGAALETIRLTRKYHFLAPARDDLDYLFHNKDELRTLTSAIAAARRVIYNEKDDQNQG